MKKLILRILLLLSCTVQVSICMRTSPITSIQRQQDASNQALAYKNAGVLIPENLIIQLHPNIKEYYRAYNRNLIAEKQAVVIKQKYQ